MEAPERIYLQAETDEDGDCYTEEGVTWCVDRINDTDVEYVRRDVAAKLWEKRLSDVCFKIAMSSLTPFSQEEMVRMAMRDPLLAETAWLADPPDGKNGEEGETLYHLAPERNAEEDDMYLSAKPLGRVKRE